MALRDFLYQMYEQVPGTTRNYVVLIRVEEDISSFAADGELSNVQAPNQADLPIHIPATPNRDRGWARPKGLIITWVANPPGGQSVGSTTFIPMFRVGRYQQTPIGAVGTFRGGSFRVSSKLPEFIRN